MTTATETNDRRVDTGVSDPAYFKAEYWRLVKENNQLRETIKELSNAMAQTDNARITQNRQENALAIYGESEEVKALTTRLNYLLPNATEIGQSGVALVAQTAIAHGLDPLPGSDHLYAWKQGKNLHVVIGYKGLLHLARRQVYFTHHSRPMTTEERTERAMKNDQIGYITEVWEIHKAKECKDNGVPYFPIVGSAVWKPGDGVPAGRDASWVVKKNSLKDALRQITSTGARLGQALDAMFAEMGRKAALPEGVNVQDTDDGWVIEMPEDDAEDIKQELIEAGYIQPDTDELGAEVDGETGEIIEAPTPGAPAVAPDDIDAHLGRDSENGKGAPAYNVFEDKRTFDVKKWPKFRDVLIAEGLADNEFHATGRLYKVYGLNEEGAKYTLSDVAEAQKDAKFTYAQIAAAFQQRASAKASEQAEAAS